MARLTFASPVPVRPATAGPVLALLAAIGDAATDADTAADFQGDDDRRNPWLHGDGTPGQGWQTTTPEREFAMLIRLNGLVLVVNTLLPLLLVLAFALAWLVNAPTIERRWSESEASLTAIRDSAAASLLVAQTAAVDVTTNLQNAAADMAEIGDSVDTAITAATEPLETIADLHVKTVSASWTTQKLCDPLTKKLCKDVSVPTFEVVNGWNYGAGLAEPFQAAFTELAKVAAPMDDVGRAVAALSGLDALPGHAAQARAALAVLADNALALAPLLTVCGYILFGLLAWYAFQRVVRGFADLQTGWRMLRAGG